MSPSKMFADSAETLPITAVLDLPEPDVIILTSGGRTIPAHSSVLGLASPVLESTLLDGKQNKHPKRNGSLAKVVPILGVPCDAVAAFLTFLYSSGRRRAEEDMGGKYGIQLLVLSHVYLVPQLKQRCTRWLAETLTVENVVDVLQLARLCDAPILCIKCMEFLAHEFKAVEKTEAWKFLQKHDVWLELEILQFIEESESRKARARRRKMEQSLYLELDAAMKCLVHICTEGCTSVGPCNMEYTKRREPCGKFSTCHGLQLLIKHFATCDKRVKYRRCSRCNRMWQLLRLHAYICDQSELCKVPLCRQFKVRMQKESKREDDAKWRLLVRKVLSAKAMSSLSRKTGSEERLIKYNNMPIGTSIDTTSHGIKPRSKVT